jgi:DNA damage-binding protein 1
MPHDPILLYHANEQQLTCGGQVEGGVYMFGTVAPQAQDLLMRFQAKLATVITTPGGIDFTSYRAFQNPERAGAGPERFIDGELIERFLDLDEDTQEEVCEGLGPTVETMRSMVEELKRMH